MKHISLILFLTLLSFKVLGQNHENYNADAKNLFLQANTAFKNGNTSESRTLYLQAIEKEPNFSEAYLNLSIVEYQDSKFEKSLEYNRKALKLNEFQYANYAQMGRNFYMLNQFDSAFYYLDQAKNFGSTNESDLFYLAVSENKIGFYSMANEILTDLVSKKSDNFEYLVQLAHSQYGMSEYESAAETYKNAYALAPNNDTKYENLAKCELKANHSSEALKWINEGIEKVESKESQINLLLLKGNYYMQINDAKNARLTFNQVLELDQNHASALANLGALNIYMGNYEVAISYLDSAIESNPGLGTAYFNRGIAYEMLKQNSEACGDWEVAFILGVAGAEEYLNSPTCNE